MILSGRLYISYNIDNNKNYNNIKIPRKIDNTKQLKYPYCYKINNNYYPVFICYVEKDLQPLELELSYIIINIKYNTISLYNTLDNTFYVTELLGSYISLYGMFFIGGQKSNIKKSFSDALPEDLNIISRICEYYNNTSSINLFKISLTNKVLDSKYKSFINKVKIETKEPKQINNIYKIKYKDYSHPSLFAYFIKQYLENNNGKNNTCFISIGRSGTGKTALLKTISRLIETELKFYDDQGNENVINVEKTFPKSHSSTRGLTIAFMKQYNSYYLDLPGSEDKTIMNSIKDIIKLIIPDFKKNFTKPDFIISLYSDYFNYHDTSFIYKYIQRVSNIFIISMDNISETIENFMENKYSKSIEELLDPMVWFNTTEYNCFSFINYKSVGCKSLMPVETLRDEVSYTSPLYKINYDIKMPLKIIELFKDPNIKILNIEQNSQLEIYTKLDILHINNDIPHKLFFYSKQCDLSQYFHLEIYYIKNDELLKTNVRDYNLFEENIFYKYIKQTLYNYEEILKRKNVLLLDNFRDSVHFNFILYFYYTQFLYKTSDIIRKIEPSKYIPLESINMDTNTEKYINKFFDSYIKYQTINNTLDNFQDSIILIDGVSNIITDTIRNNRAPPSINFNKLNNKIKHYKIIDIMNSNPFIDYKLDQPSDDLYEKETRELIKDDNSPLENWDNFLNFNNLKNGSSLSKRKFITYIDKNNEIVVETKNDKNKIIGYPIPNIENIYKCSKLILPNENKIVKGFKNNEGTCMYNAFFYLLYNIDFLSKTKNDKLNTMFKFFKDQIEDNKIIDPYISFKPIKFNEALKYVYDKFKFNNQQFDDIIDYENAYRYLASKILINKSGFYTNDNDIINNLVLSSDDLFIFLQNNYFPSFNRYDIKTSIVSKNNIINTFEETQCILGIDAHAVYYDTKYNYVINNNIIEIDQYNYIANEPIIGYIYAYEPIYKSKIFTNRYNNLIDKSYLKDYTSKIKNNYNVIKEYIYYENFFKDILFNKYTESEYSVNLSILKFNDFYALYNSNMYFKYILLFCSISYQLFIGFKRSYNNFKLTVIKNNIINLIKFIKNISNGKKDISIKIINIEALLDESCNFELIKDGIRVNAESVSESFYRVINIFEIHFKLVNMSFVYFNLDNKFEEIYYKKTLIYTNIYGYYYPRYKVDLILKEVLEYYGIDYEMPFKLIIHSIKLKKRFPKLMSNNVNLENISKLLNTNKYKSIQNIFDNINNKQEILII
jgi:hypothetical protein